MDLKHQRFGTCVVVVPSVGLSNELPGNWLRWGLIRSSALPDENRFYNRSVRDRLSPEKRGSGKYPLNLQDPRTRLLFVPLKRNTQPDHWSYMPLLPPHEFAKYPPTTKMVVYGRWGSDPRKLEGNRPRKARAIPLERSSGGVNQRVDLSSLVFPFEAPVPIRPQIWFRNPTLQSREQSGSNKSSLLCVFNTLRSLVLLVSA